MHPARPVQRVLQAADVQTALAKRSPTLRDIDATARSALGDTVGTRAVRAAHHARRPAYASGKFGTVEAVRGAQVFANAHAHAQRSAAQRSAAPRPSEAPRWLYRVAIDGRELWGDDAEAGLSVTLDG